MKKKKIWIIAFSVIIVLAGILIDSMPKKPYGDLSNEDVIAIEVYAMNPVPPATKVIDDRYTINEIVDLVKTIETSHIYIRLPSGGQLVRFTLTLNSGETVEIGVYGNRIRADNLFDRKANYDVCEKLNSLANRLLETGF